jgi:hypothetical protein
MISALDDSIAAAKLAETIATDIKASEPGESAEATHPA